MKKTMMTIAALTFATSAVSGDVKDFYKFQHLGPQSEEGEKEVDGIIQKYAKHVDLKIGSGYSTAEKYKIRGAYSACIFDHIIEDSQVNDLPMDYVYEQLNNLLYLNMGLIIPEQADKYKEVVTYKAKLQESCLDYMPNKDVFLQNKFESYAIGNFGCLLDYNNCYNEKMKEIREEFNIPKE